MRGGVLQYLRIRNLALLEAVELEFGPGFTAVTGETGAGKSILLGALQLLAGARIDKTAIRQGAPAAEVEASLFFQWWGRRPSSGTVWPFCMLSVCAEKVVRMMALVR